MTNYSGILFGVCQFNIFSKQTTFDFVVYFLFEPFGTIPFAVIQLKLKFLRLRGMASPVGENESRASLLVVSDQALTRNPFNLGVEAHDASSDRRMRLRSELLGKSSPYRQIPFCGLDRSGCFPLARFNVHHVHSFIR